MAKLTIDIDMEDTQESWDALYRQIEDFKEPAPPQKPKNEGLATPPATYDLLFDPERAYAGVGEVANEVDDFFAILTRQES